MASDEHDPQGESLSQELPKPTLASLAHMIFLQGMIASGKIISPMSNKYETDVAMAKYHVDLLELLQNKTSGNRSAEEDEAFEEMLHQLRLAFVDATKQR